MSETPIVKSILQALAARGTFCWRANSGTIVLGKGADKRVVRGAPAGTPDIIGALKGGRLFGLEVKTATGRLRPSQRTWAEKATALGARCGVVRSAREAVALIEAWEREEGTSR